MLFDRAGAGADYEALHVVQDGASGLRAVVAVHSTLRGPSAGGIRRVAYASEEEALADALRLASAMTLKNAFAELPAGGGKTVVLDHAGLDRAGAYRALGRAIESLGGAYQCGGDVGTGEAELAFVRETTRQVNPPSNDANAATARGVLAALRGALAFRHGTDTVEGRRFLVQGLGGVGGEVARRLRAQGARVLGADPNPEARRAAAAHGVEMIALDAALSTPCDAFLPCALGGVLTVETARALPAQIVCGAANNQLREPEAARVLHERDVAYVPDFVANAGAAIEGVLTMRHGATPQVRQAAAAHIDATRGRVLALLESARDSGRLTVDEAVRLARERLVRPAAREVPIRDLDAEAAAAAALRRQA